MIRLRRTSVSVGAFACIALAAAIWTQASAPEGQVREFTVEGNEFAFSPARLEAQKDDLIKVTFTARDMAHSFTIDEYRIAKRAGAGQTVVFEFRADRTGPFTFYCNLSQNDRCREMKGHLQVR